MPAVERQVKELLGCEPSHSLNPDECVAMGAAVQGGLLQGGGKLAGATGAAAQGLVLMDVTPLTLSIETLGGVATPLITRNSMIPTRKSQIFTTARPMQTSVEINVLQGERHFARDNKSLGKFKLNGIRASFSSKPQIEVTFDIDVNGVVKVSAKDLGTGREQNITITGSTNLSENEIQRAMNQVDDADLLALLDEEPQDTEFCTCTVKCEAGNINENCSLCEKSLRNCTAPEAAKNDIETPQEKPKSNMGSLIILLVLALAGGGAALYYFKFRKPKADTTGHDDLDEYDFGEDEDADEEPAEIEIHSEDGQEDET